MNKLLEGAIEEIREYEDAGNIVRYSIYRSIGESVYKETIDESRLGANSTSE